MATLQSSLRPTARLLRPSRLSRPMATASRHVSLSPYLFPRSASSASDKPPSPEMQVGELEGASFKIEPLRRVGEDAATMRARLLYQSRKRGTLESDLLLSTFAEANLASMSPAQLQQYDLFLDENDWDIYYWATQEPEPVSGGSSRDLTPGVHHETVERDAAAGDEEVPRPRSEGEWAQTVGTFKPAYRPVPARWRDSEVLAMLRAHVKERGMGKGGMAFMPRLR